MYATGEMVVDPFSGSATTLTVAKKLGRQFFGFELSQEYFERGSQRIASAIVGDFLEGSEEPRASAPSTFQHLKNRSFRQPTLFEQELGAEAKGLIEAFAAAHRGFSADRLVADPLLNQDFQDRCDQLSVPGNPSDRNRFLFRLRKAGRLASVGIETTERTEFDWEQIDPFLHASEIAWRQLSQLYSATLEDIFCDIRLAEEFDRIAARFAPAGRRSSTGGRPSSCEGDRRATGNPPDCSSAVHALVDQADMRVEAISVDRIPKSSGVFVVRMGDSRSDYLYVGETLHLRDRLDQIFSSEGLQSWYECGRRELSLQFLEASLDVPLAHQLAVLHHVRGSLWNSPDSSAA